MILTGASGFIGSRVAHALWERGHAVAILKRTKSDLRRISRLMADAANVAAYDLESTPVQQVFDNHSPDAVVHLATVYGRQGESLSEILAGNVVFPLALLEAAIQSGTELFLNADSFSSRGDSLPEGLEGYVLSKRQFRQCAALAATKSRTRLVNAQIEHPYGPEDGKGKFVPTVIRALIENKAEFQLTAGEQCRDFVFVEDVADAFVALVESADRFPSGVTNVEIGTGVSMKLREFVGLAKDLAGSSTTLRFGALPYRSNEMMHSVADLSGMRLLGWSPRVSVEEGLLRTIESSRR